MAKQTVTGFLLRIQPQVTMDDVFIGQCSSNALRLALMTDIRVNLLGFSR